MGSGFPNNVINPQPELAHEESTAFLGDPAVKQERTLVACIIHSPDFFLPPSSLQGVAIFNQILNIYHQAREAVL